MLNNIKPFAPVIINLLKGVLYEDNSQAWNLLIQYEPEVKKHFEGIGIDVYVDEAEGYAFLKQQELNPEENDGELALPALIERRQLSYPITLLCVLLRKRLLEEDASGGNMKVVLSKEEIVDMIRVFLPEHSNEAKIIDSIDTYINRIISYGFLRKLKNEEGKFEVKRIIKAKITADILQNIEQKLKDYARPD
jgi:hypothetical protein